jgi:hypothetical protein
MRRKIEKQVATCHEHIIIFTNPENSTQIWQWVKREPGKPAAESTPTTNRSQAALIKNSRNRLFAPEEETSR